jgi:hypothetical protein
MKAYLYQRKMPELGATKWTKWSWFLCLGAFFYTSLDWFRSWGLRLRREQIADRISGLAPLSDNSEREGGARAPASQQVASFSSACWVLANAHVLLVESDPPCLIRFGSKSNGTRPNVRLNCLSWQLDGGYQSERGSQWPIVVVDLLCFGSLVVWY